MMINGRREQWDKGNSLWKKRVWAGVFYRHFVEGRQIFICLEKFSCELFLLCW